MLDYTYHGAPLSLYNISKYMLGYNKLVPEVHGVWCDELEEERLHHRRILKMMPRGTFKTTLLTISQSIELLMQDWIENNGVFTKRILIASATDDLANQILGEVTTHFEQNKNLHGFFGYNPVKSSKQGELRLYPKSIKKEPTIRSRGALSSTVGEHFDYILLDDIVNSLDRESQAKRDQNWRWYIDLISILEPDGYLFITGTRWHFDDVYAKIMDINKKLPDDQKYSIKVEGAIDEDTGLTRFPSILSNEKIASLKIEKGIIEFAAQYMNRCLSVETQLFPIEKMHFYPEYGPNSEDQFKGYYKTIAYCDPSLGKSEKGDYAVLIIATLWKKRLYIRDVYISNTTTPSAMAKIAEQMMDNYDVGALYLEANGFQTLYARDFKERNITVIEYRNTKNKEVRIEGLEPYVTGGKVVFREDWDTAYPKFIDQLNMYPATEHDDAPDALEAITKIAFGTQTGKFEGRGLAGGISRTPTIYTGRPQR
jgi:predicted phage terminase large subunit-like protein